MTPQRNRFSLLVALATLLAACVDPAGPGVGVTPEPAVLSAETPLQLSAEYKVAQVDEEFIREIVEIKAQFIGTNPIDPETGRPYENLALVFTSPETEYKSHPEKSTSAELNMAWELDGGDGFSLKTSDPQAVLDAIKVQVLEGGQVVADVTEYVAAVSARIVFRPDIKAWELRLELGGIVTPTMIITPSMLKTITGAAVGALHVNHDQLTARVESNEARFETPGLVTKAETKIEDGDGGGIREVTEIVAVFQSTELQLAALADLQLAFEINLGGNDDPFVFGIVIPSDVWSQQTGKKIIEPQWTADKIGVFVLQDGQFGADLTNLVDDFEAKLIYRLSNKSWELRLEIDGIVIPSHIQPLFTQIGAARIAELDVGGGLESISARLREAAALF